ncbi:hypothetical protein [Demequina litorisediminis]|uniref:Uncharacterized protein n=1 Tax=Demequina litorisediminis TaxID=1849022 RepID=A0ABQ6I9J7_9MICO|nr:hypothetical protein [Demequina litorisediminis]GMA34391.1 hypothetical protein GCM10025876_05950 [Demequina litorisediminis]
MTARRQGPLLAALAGLVALLALPTVTAAAWTDDAWFTSSASAGTWDDGGGGDGGGGGIDGGDNTDIIDITWTVRLAGVLLRCRGSLDDVGHAGGLDDHRRSR